MDQIFDSQSSHDQFQSQKHNLKITIVCDQLTGPANVGAVLRLADAFGVEKVVFIGGLSSITPRVKSVARGCEKVVSHSFVSDYELANDYLWIALEITQNSKALADFTLPKEGRIGIVIGNEQEGVSDYYLQKCSAYHIKMFGENSSMNVANALAAALFHLTQ